MDLSADKRPILVVGRVGMDVIVDPPGTGVGEAKKALIDIGGSSANIAVGLVKLGQQASLVTTVSDDAVARFCVGKLAEYGVDTSHIRTVSGECRTSLAIYDSCLETHTNTIYRNNAADFQMSLEDVAEIDYAAFRCLITAGTVFAAEPSRSAAFAAFEKARAAGLPVIFDIDYRPYSWPSPEVAADVLSRAGDLADLIVGNDEEFGFMAGDYGRGLAKAKALAEGGRTIVYKRGPEGAITFADGTEIATGIYPVQALKPVGAGDSFMAGFISGLSEGDDLRAAILKGSACASITVSRPGCAPALPTPDDLTEFLSSHPGPTGA
ncbi:PfkB family carbohydrate kinase [Primorskyibacter sp. S187A]|uniref:PfkB family carbohydrate kinase n=1 Tax=Primorskyibacter sp. S187A TaxID=3415130 RepID=UPI003C7CCE12